MQPKPCRANQDQEHDRQHGNMQNPPAPPPPPAPSIPSSYAVWNVPVQAPGQVPDATRQMPLGHMMPSWSDVLQSSIPATARAVPLVTGINLGADLQKPETSAVTLVAGNDGNGLKAVIGQTPQETEKDEAGARTLLSMSNAANDADTIKTVWPRDTKMLRSLLAESDARDKQSVVRDQQLLLDLRRSIEAGNASRAAGGAAGGAAVGAAVGAAGGTAVGTAQANSEQGLSELLSFNMTATESELAALRQVTAATKSSLPAADFDITALATPVDMPQDGWDGWKDGKLHCKDLPVQDIKYKSTKCYASDMAAELKVKAQYKPGAQVEMITAIYYVDEGHTDTHQLWNMGSFAYGLAGDRWHCQRKANEAVRNDQDLKKYDSRIIIETKQLEVILVNLFVLDSTSCTEVLIRDLRTNAFGGTKFSTSNLVVLNLPIF